MVGPTIKSLTWWTLDSEYESKVSGTNTHVLGGGIWEARSAFINEDSRAYEFVCVISFHADVKLGDTRKMYEDVVLALCHPVTLTHLPKPDKRDVAIDDILSSGFDA